MTDHAPESRLIDLVGGLLSPDESRTTMAHLRECDECEERYRTIVADRESLRAGPAPVMRDGRIELVQPARRPRTGIRVGVAAAALAIGVFGVLHVLDRDAPPEYWIPVSEEKTVLRSPNGTDTMAGMASALRSYQARDAAAAVTELESFTPASGDVTAVTLRDLYLASALINANRPGEGLEILERIGIPWMPTPWRYHAQWIRYTALVRADRSDEALAYLEKLAEEPGEIGEKARIELQRYR